MKQYNVKDAFGRVDGAFALELLKQAPFPRDLVALGEKGIKNIWHGAKLRGRGYNRAGEIIRYAGESIGLTDGTDAGRTAVRWFAEKITELDRQLDETEAQLHQKRYQASSIRNGTGSGMTI